MNGGERPKSAVEYALDALNRDARVLAVIEEIGKMLAGQIERHDTELAELRDEMLALSNRIEAATRSAVTGGTLLHSVKVDRREP